MPQIEIITAAPAALASSGLAAPSIASNIKDRVVEAAKSLASNSAVINFIDTEVLSKNLKEFLQNMQPVFDEVSSSPGNFRINEIELSLAISAEGGIKLIGEFSVGFQTGITLKLSRNK